MHPRPAPQARRRPARALAAVAGFGLLAAGLSGVGPATAAPAAPAEPSADQLDAFVDGRYVVTLTGDPAASYGGGIAGLAATKPAQGQTLDAADPEVVEYQAYLEQEQTAVAATVDAAPERQFTTALNGFTADLTAEQAASLALRPGVLAVTRDEARQLDTIDSPAFLGLSGEGGVWDQLGGPDATGEGVVVGVLDTGIAPANPSFAGEAVTATTPGDEVGSTFRTRAGNVGVVKADGDVFEGECEVAVTFTADLCNDKLVSARYFADGFLAAVGPDGASRFEEISPRDGDGHGSHTAGTAAGNDGVEMVVDGRSFGEGSGVAPGAKIASYKVCWDAADPAFTGCYTSDLVDAVEAAVLDGVDVINFSISGATTTSVDPVELAFLSAASADVFVAASAGNSGPGASTVAHNSPWVTTVAASTHHYFYGTVRTGDGRQFRGISVTEELPEQTPTVLSSRVGSAGAVAANVARCYPGALDPALVAGKVVVCDRGGNDRTEKSRVVRDAGGVGMVLANVTTGSVDADVHYVPTVHVDEVAGAAIKAYVAAAEAPTTALLTGDQTGAQPEAAPVIAGFSSRGPALAHSGDLLKPDISAPGVSVLAAVAPQANEGRDFNFLSGTSMSSPHMAGLAALVLGEKPDWSPMAVKSAAMTTAYDLSNPDGSRSTDRFASGAGHVDPTRFLDPGLVYESDEDDWLAFLEASEGFETGIDGINPLDDPSNLNQPSIAVGALAGQQTVTRTVTATRPGIYRVNASVPGMDVRVTPRVLNFNAAGESRTFQVRLTRTTAPVGQYAQGTLTWQGGGTSVRSPVVARPVVADAPAAVQGQVADGQVTFPVVPGSSSPIDVDVQGLVPATRSTGDLVAGEGVFVGRTNTSTDVYPVDITAGTTVARMDLRGGEGDDVNVYVTNAAGQLVASSTSAGADAEQITLRRPAAGRYLVHVHAPGTAGTAVDYTLDTFLVTGSAGNATATPDPLRNRQGYARDLTVSWTGVQQGTPHLGVVTYAGTTDFTVVDLD